MVNLNNKNSRRFTASPALGAEDVDLVVEGRPIGLRGEDGKVKPVRIAVNPITLSADGETLFFGAMNGETRRGYYAKGRGTRQSPRPSRRPAPSRSRTGPLPTPRAITIIGITPSPS